MVSYFVRDIRLLIKISNGIVLSIIIFGFAY